MRGKVGIRKVRGWGGVIGGRVGAHGQRTWEGRVSLEVVQGCLLETQVLVAKGKREMGDVGSESELADEVDRRTDSATAGLKRMT